MFLLLPDFYPVCVYYEISEKIDFVHCLMRKYWIFCLVILFANCSKPVFREKWIHKKAPDRFTAVFETSRGFFTADFERSASPLAIDRLYAQFKHGYYDHSLFYRVRPAYVVQFGGDDSVKQKAWNRIKIPDEPVIKPNIRGAISFARAGRNSRDNDLFINLVNNSPFLDTVHSNGVQGFPALGQVRSGMEVVDSLYNGYGDAVFGMYDVLFKNKTVFLSRYPKLDSLISVRLVKTK